MAMAMGQEDRVLVRPGIGISNSKSAPGLPGKPLVRLGSPWPGLNAPGSNRSGRRRRRTSTDNKATQASALSFELGLGVAIMHALPT